MGENSAIEWTGDTWNVVTGCTKVSPACANCYIERTIPFRTKNRVFVNGHIPLEFHESRLSVPLKKRRATVYFVNSLSDLFHEDVPDTFIDRVFAVMSLAPCHTFQVLTKRPARMRAYLTRHDVGLQWLVNGYRLSDKAADEWAYQENDAVRWTREGLPNVWLGVSVENQHFANKRIPILLQTPAAVRFISAEPLLGPVNFSDVVMPDGDHLNALFNDGTGSGLDWVIAGGESGPRVRRSDPYWFRSLRDQCVTANVPFFFKQWGGRSAKVGGRVLDGRTWDEMPRTSGEAQSASSVAAEEPSRKASSTTSDIPMPVKGER